MSDKFDQAIEILKDINHNWGYNDTSTHGNLLAILIAHKEDLTSQDSLLRKTIERLSGENEKLRESNNKMREALDVICG